MYYIERGLGSGGWVIESNHATYESVITAYDRLCKETTDALQVVQRVEKIMFWRDSVNETALAEESVDG